MLIAALITIGGLILVVYGANFLVDGASGLAVRLNISPIVIGLTIVAFGTSAPELTVSMLAASQNNSDLAVSNIIGSNILNILLILGLSAVIQPLKVSNNTVWKEIPLSLLAALVVFACINDQLIDGADVSVISRIDGIILLFFFVIFMYYNFYQAKYGSSEGMEDVKPMPIWKTVVWMVLGMAGLIYGGKLIVDGATDMAVLLEIPQSVIGLTVVSLGTSMPELATSVVAAYKKKADIAVGNVVGSNIFNIFLILGLSATVSPLPMGNITQTDLLINILASLLLFLTAYIGRSPKITRLEGGILLAVYVAYTIYVLG